VATNDIDALVRSRLRSIRISRGWSLDDLAARSHLSASTISRVETGKRTISLDVLQPLCRALHVALDELLDTSTDDDVVIRPLPESWPGATMWPLTRHRDGNGIFAAKVRYEPTGHRPVPQVHPGHDWFFVVSGAVELTLGDRTIIVEEGQAAEFSTMTPHAFAAHGGPAEIITILDRDGQHAHGHGHTGRVDVT
jgi:transcriptional regulator with XRE-family HTH domain